MRRTRLWGVLFAAILCALPSVALAEMKVTYNLGVEPRTVDPARANANDQQIVIFNTYEGLVRPDQGGEMQPGAAEKWEVSDDQLTWTFHLREGLKWSDGKPLSAGDFRYGFIRAMSADTACPYATTTFFIKNAEKLFKGKCSPDEVGIEAPDDRTLVLHLEYPSPLILNYLSFITFMPSRQDIVEKDPTGWTSAMPIVSNGPFYVSEWRHNSQMTLKKNPNYWDAADVKLDELRFLMIVDTNTALTAFKAGDVDLLSTLPAMMTPSLLASGEAKTLPSLGTYFVIFNTKQEPFNNPKVRRAFALALDRKTLVEKVTQGGQRPAVAFISDGIPGADPKGADFRGEDPTKYLPLSADADQAKKLLAEAGYPDGKGFPHVTFMYNTNPLNKSLAEAFQAMWKKNLGIDVELQNQEWKVYLETTHSHHFQMGRMAWTPDFNDPTDMMELWTTQNYENTPAWSNAEYDKAMSAARGEMNRAKRFSLLHEAEKVLMDELPISPVYFYSINYMLKDYVKGVYLSPLAWILFRDAYVVEH